VIVKQLKTNKMKRNENKVPEFDEIIFENRNKEYGAYNLRRNYKSATSLSILWVVLLASAIILTIFLTTDDSVASSPPPVIVIAAIDNFKPEKIKQPETKMPPELIKATTNLAPTVTTDTSEITADIPITEEIIETTVNKKVPDSVIVEDVPTDIVPKELEPFVKVEEDPLFPGGDEALLNFIATNTVYPEEALNNNIEGRVILKFVVTPDGSVGKIQILKGVDPMLDQEASRVVSILPKFKPGKQGGTPVPVWYTVPVLFRINR
jgi:protein TonB